MPGAHAVVPARGALVAFNTVLLLRLAVAVAVALALVCALGFSRRRSTAGSR